MKSVFFQRCVRNVGHGGFFTEKFDAGNMIRPFNVVYDCGSKSTKAINCEIDKAYGESDVIDILFISHFDIDHVNGIAHLLKRVKSIKRIVLPILGALDDIFLSLSPKLNKMYNEIISNSNPKIGEVIFVKKSNPKDRNSPKVNPNQDDNDKGNTNNENMFSNIPTSDELESLGYTQTIYLGNLPFWEYIPFNFDDAQMCKKVVNAFNNSPISKHPGLVRGDIDSIQKYFQKPENLKFGKDLFRKLRIKKNPNCLVVLSKAISDFVTKPNYWDGIKLSSISCGDMDFFCFPQLGIASNNSFPTGSLYLGDFNAEPKKRFIALKNKYQKYEKTIGILQLPHHGSLRNFNTRFFQDFHPLLAFCCAKFGDIKHPVPEVVKQVPKNVTFLNITEKAPPRLVQYGCLFVGTRLDFLQFDW
jgi:hypothetical protein